MADTVPASEFTRNFGRYRMLAQREAVAVSSHGSITGYFIAPGEYEEFRRFKQRRSSFATTFTLVPYRTHLMSLWEDRHVRPSRASADRSCARSLNIRKRSERTPAHSCTFSTSST